MNKARTFVRPFTAAERHVLEQGRKSADAFTVRRSQVLLASAARMAPADIGRVVGCTARAVRNAVRAFEADGLGCLAAKSHARKDPGRVWDRAKDEGLKDRPLRSPRGFGKPTGLWAPALAAEACHERGWTPRVLSAEATRRTLQRLGGGWRRAKHRITRPDPGDAKKKSAGTGGPPRPPPAPTGPSGSRTSAGGPASPSPGGSPGPAATRSGWGPTPGTRRAAGRRRSAATGCAGRTPAG